MATTQAKKSTKKPQTMESLLAETGYTMVVPKKGDTVKGTITSKKKKTLTIDIGAKTEGFVVDKEFALAKDYIDELNVGDEIDAQVVSSENDRGQVMLSLKKAALDSKWSFFEKAQADDTVLSVKGLDVNKGGLIVGINGVRGFVPSSQFGKEYIGTFQKLRGKDLDVKVIEVERDKNRLIFSERHVSEASEIAQRDQALNSVEVDKIYKGVVSGVMPFGLFVTVGVPVEGKKDEVGHVEGLVHISEISWEKVNNPADYHKVGDEIDVRVLGVDDNTGKLNLSIKQLSDDPWKVIAQSYPVGTTFTGTVSRVEQFGVFVNVEKGVDGLIHMSKLSPDHTYQTSEEVTVTVESIDPDQRRMSLSPVLTEVPVGYK
jgi:ribosomal protein S1